MQTEPCHLCGAYPSTVIWQGRGPMCPSCFNEEYKKINSDGPKERQEKIKRNFDKSLNK